MKTSSNIFLILLLVLLSSGFFLYPSPARSEEKKDTGGGKSLFGAAAILSNYLDNGITQSDGSWAIQSGFGYNLGPQVQVGIWGSSVKLPPNSEHLNLRPHIKIRIEMTQNVNLDLRYDMSKYFQASTYDTGIVTADLGLFNYHVIIKQTGNWEGTQTTATWFGFQKEYAIPWGLLFTPRAGYSQLSANGYTNYFDLQASLGYKFADVLYELGATTTSSPSQFNGRGATALYLKMFVQF